MEDFDMDKEYTDVDFDRMLIPLYGANGYPYLDEFEYTDALINNSAVEKLRKEYFRQKAEKEQGEIK
jgi:hypothetical protein